MDAFKVVIVAFALVLAGFGLSQIVAERKYKTETDRVKPSGVNEMSWDRVAPGASELRPEITTKQRTRTLSFGDQVPLLETGGFDNGIRAYGLYEAKGVWNRIRVDKRGRVICSKE